MKNLMKMMMAAVAIVMCVCSCGDDEDDTSEQSNQCREGHTENIQPMVKIGHGEYHHHEDAFHN